MKTRWHHLVTYATSHCLPPPQPHSMSTPLSHCLVDFRLSPSSWPTTTVIVINSILHLLAFSFTPLLSCVPPPSSPIFRRGRVHSVTSPSPPASPPPSPYPSYLHRILFDCCVLTVVVIVCLALSLFRLLLLFGGAAVALSVNLPQPSSTSSSKPRLPPTLTNVFLFYCCVLFRCRIVPPSSSGGGHPAHRIRHRRCRRRPSSSSLSWPLPLSLSSSSS